MTWEAPGHRRSQSGSNSTAPTAGISPPQSPLEGDDMAADMAADAAVMPTSNDSQLGDPLAPPNLGGETSSSLPSPSVHTSSTSRVTFANDIPSTIDRANRIRVRSNVTIAGTRKKQTVAGPSVLTRATSSGSGSGTKDDEENDGEVAGLRRGSHQITRDDINRIFTPSVTTATVSREEIVRVKEMHDRISEGASFSFNYYCLIIIASFVAGLGLVSDSSTTVISSMLLSPIMGPVIGMSYGTVIWDWTLVRRCVRNEIASLIICIAIGVIVGVSCSWTEMADDWPTNEMATRAELQTFYIGIPIAFCSGLGVALSVLDDSMSSLVGVAISASLLPPAVNAGVHWGAVGFEGSQKISRGWTSMGLALVNILVVWLSAALMFRVKEVLPVKKKVFWDDLKTARRIYQRRALVEESTGSEDFAAIRAQLQEELEDVS